jgi:hypothetical protein
MRAIDPDNILLTRGPRTRLAAETVRDLALASSGLLVNDVGGPSFKVYQPKGIWESATSGRGVLARYVQDHGDDLYRRGLYSFIKRTVPPPGMLVFDASNRDQCEVNRLRTNTPLQALVVMNDPTILEASRVFAERLVAQNVSDERRIVAAFRSIVCRMPLDKERDLLVRYLAEERQRFSAAPDLAEKLVAVGEYPRSEVPDVTELAALMQVVHTIYNMEESITKG